MFNQTRQSSGWSLGPRAAPARWFDRTSVQLLVAVDAGLAATFCLAPFVFGGRHDLGRLVFVALVAFTSVAWFLRQALLPQAAWPRTWAYALFALAIAALGLQLAPLPADWIARLAPRTAELLPIWTAGPNQFALGNWSTLSLTPRETTLSLAMLASYALLFAVVAQRIASTGDVERLLNTIAVAAVVMAAFGLVQFFASNGRFFWFYVHPFRTTDHYAMGSFSNRNHFASFLVLGVGPLVRWLVAMFRAMPGARGHRREPTGLTDWLKHTLLLAGLVVVLLAILLSCSRGGAMALATAALTVSAIYWRWHLIDAKYIGGFAVVAFVMLGLLSLYGYDEVTNRLDDFVSGSVETLDRADGRRKVWTANVTAIERGGLFGSGAGSHLAINPVYLAEPTTKYYTHAENGYLQIGTENGFVGITLLAFALALVGSWCCAGFTRIQDTAAKLSFGAAVAGIAASLVHSVVDFVWYIPACMSLTIALAAATLRLVQLAMPAEWQPRVIRILPRGRWIECTALATLAGGWTVHAFVGPGIAAVHWERYQRDVVARSRLFRDSSLPNAKTPTASELAILAPLEDALERHLRDTLAWDPSFARAHLRLAACYVQRFENTQQDAVNVLTPTQIRDAVFAAEFPSPAAQQAWLRRAFGADIDWLARAEAHARRAVTLSPLEGDGYIFLANLGFLAGDPPARVAACIGQAERVRPYDGEVAYEAGKQALVDGDLESAMRYFARCFASPGAHQLRIVGLLAGRVPANVFLEELHPNWLTLREIWAAYLAKGRQEDLQSLITYAAQVTERDARANSSFRPAPLWLYQAQLHADFHQQDRALACLNQAYALDPQLYDVRRALGFAQQAAGNYAEAEPHLRWCLARRPNDKALTAAVRELSKLRVITYDPATVTAKFNPQAP